MNTIGNIFQSAGRWQQKSAWYQIDSDLTQTDYHFDVSVEGSSVPQPWTSCKLNSRNKTQKNK